jgi:rSAM/selenodomain-associated transferase 1
MVDASLAVPDGADVVAVLTRAPAAGGKRRLFAELGCPADPTLLEALLLDTVDRVRASGYPAVIFVEPAARKAEVEALMPDLPAWPQGDGDLGSRMGDALRVLFRAGAKRVALVGSDLPDLVPSRITAAFAALAEEPRRLVLGPAQDGGYYLLAATVVPTVFDGIDWGTSRVLTQTVAAAGDAGIPVHLIDTASDVDTVADLQAAAAAGAARTRTWWVTHRAPEL